MRWLWIAFVVIVLYLKPSAGSADGLDDGLSVGDRVRYIPARAEIREGTVVATSPDAMVVVGDYSAWRDSVNFGSLESLEVRLRSFNMALGLVGGAAIGALAGAAVARVAASGDEWGSAFAPIYIGAPVGALIGGVVGIAYAHDRGTRWKSVPLLAARAGADAPPNKPLQPAAPHGGQW
jgi:hypothetical protein